MTYEISLNDKIYKLIITKKRIKRIIIRMNYRYEILLSIPNQINYSDAINYIFQNSNWIKSIDQKYRLLDAKFSFTYFYNNNIIYLKGEKYYLEKDKNLKESYLLKGNIIYYKNDVKKAIEKIYQDSFYLIEAEFNNVYHAFNSYINKIPKLVIRKMKSRWGSCNYQSGKININKMLVSVPSKLLNYVIVHEFTHLIYPNHGKSFYSLLGKIIPNYKELEKELKQYAFLLN